MKYHGKDLKHFNAEATEQELDNLIEYPDKSSSLKLIKKLLISLPFIVIAFVVLYASPIGAYLSKVSEMSEKIRSFGLLAPVVFVLANAILVSVGVPRLLFCPIAGMAFGFVWGVLYSCLGALLAYYAVFLFVRWHMSDFQLGYQDLHKRLSGILEKGGIPAVILARQVPVHGMLVNIVLGLSPVRHRDFLIGTMIGLLPEAVPCVLVGTSAAQSSLRNSVAYLAGAMIILAIAWVGLVIYGKRATASCR